jgi:hypothetical protein
MSSRGLESPRTTCESLHVSVLFAHTLTAVAGSCVAMDTIIRVVGAVSLWSVEIVMQLRVYALYDCSKRVI